MKRLLGLLLGMGMVGCGPSEEESVAALEKLGATKIKRNEQGEIIEVLLNKPNVTDAGLVHLNRLATLQRLSLSDTGVTNPGLVHLKDLTKLETLSLGGTQITDA